MKLQFDPNQPYQLDAVAAVTDLFDGQPQDSFCGRRIGG
jgi:type III restriction enzyme